MGEGMSGGLGDDVLEGGIGDDTLDGLEGNDRLIGRAGADSLLGGDGLDTADYRASPSRLNVNLVTGIGVGGDAHGDRLYGIEQVFGSVFGDTMIGSVGSVRFFGLGGNDSLRGGYGNDLLDGGAGVDTMLGGAGDDVLIGGAGADDLRGGAGNDTADYSGSATRVNVSLTTGHGYGADAHGDRLAEIEHLIGTQHQMPDLLTGNAGANRISGLKGDDLLAGLAGADTLDGGPGTDTADYRKSAAVVNVDLTRAAQTGGDAAGDRLIAVENLLGTSGGDTLTGDAVGNRIDGLGGDDRLDGGVGDDTLIGGDGADRLVGAAGNDELTGGAGHDIFRFEQADGSDVITDFTPGAGAASDRIEIRGDLVGAPWELRTFEILVPDEGTDPMDPSWHWEVVTLLAPSSTSPLERARQVGDDVLFELSYGYELTLRGVQLSSLAEDDVVTFA